MRQRGKPFASARAEVEQVWRATRSSQHDLLETLRQRSARGSITEPAEAPTLNRPRLGLVEHRV